MNKLLQKFVNLDRRIIYILVSLAVVIPLIYPLYIKINITPTVQNVYDTIENLPPRSVIFLALDFDPASKPELYPMAEAVLRHAFKKNHRVIGMTFWLNGIGLGDKVFADTAAEVSKETGREIVSGKDYVYLGWQIGDVNLVITMNDPDIGIKGTWPKDNYGRLTANMPALDGVNTLKDINYLVELAAGSSIGAWYFYGKAKAKFLMGAGCTGVMASSYYNLMKIGWINGFMGGLRGAAEYETLLKKAGKATGGMDAQSVTHMLIILSILLSNIAYFVNRSKGNQGKGSSNG